MLWQLHGQLLALTGWPLSYTAELWQYSGCYATTALALWWLHS